MSAPRIVFLVHGRSNSIEAARARGLSQNHPADQVHFLWRETSRLATGKMWHRKIQTLTPDLIYVINTALPGALLACGWPWRHDLPFVLDTGDVVYEMARQAGTTPAWKQPLLRWVESRAQRLAHTIVVRGTRHQEYLRAQGHPRVALIRDGYLPTPEPDPAQLQSLRERLGLAQKWVVGVLGSLVFSPRLGICYGWDLIQALAELRDTPWHGLVIGDGPGQNWLEAQARLQGVAERVTFCGRIPHAEVPVYLGLLDVALSTQTNNLPGQVRTTGKLAEYLGAQRFMLASRVGEAALLLPAAMLIDYAGAVDLEYPRKLAARLRQLWKNPAELELRQALREVAEKNCAYPVLAKQFDAVVAAATSRS